MSVIHAALLFLMLKTKEPQRPHHPKVSLKKNSVLYVSRLRVLMTRCSVILIKLLRHPFVARILHQQRRNDQRMTKASMFIIRQFEVRTQFRARLQRIRKEKKKSFKKPADMNSKRSRSAPLIRFHDFGAI